MLEWCYLIFSVKGSGIVTQRRKEELQLIFDTLDITFWTNDIINQKIYVSKGIEKLTGYSTQKYLDGYSFWFSIIYPEDLPIATELYDQLLSGYSAEAELRMINSRGEFIWVLLSGTPIFKEHSNDVIKINGTVTDITERKKAEAYLQESENRYRSVVELSPIIIILIQDYKIVYANPTTLDCFRVKHIPDFLNKSINDFLVDESQEKALKSILSIQKGQRGNEFEEYTVQRLDGEPFVAELLGTNITFEGKPATLVVGKDITERKKQEEEIKHLAYHDTLTGLPNRVSFTEELGEAITNSRDQQELAVMFIDLDRFKVINDTYGHDQGDLLLKQVSNRLLSCVRSQDTVSRQGGDEFVLLLKDITHKETEQVAAKIIQTLSYPFILDGNEIQSTPSIGISLYPSDAADTKTLIKYADLAMYKAKEKGKFNFQFFSQELSELTTRKLLLENDLRKALEQEQLEVWYQPQLDLKTNKIVSMEALLRWHHPQKDWISPADFIPLAEETGLILPLGEWVLNAATKQAKTWIDKGLELSVSVNLSNRQLILEDIVDTVKKSLRNNKLDPKYLCLEITESLAIMNMRDTISKLKELRDFGIDISLDDFGQGYSSLSYLNILPIKELKIDKAFIQEITIEETKKEIVNSIKNIAQKLDMRVVAEGVEDVEQFQMVRLLGLDLVQGYYLSRPIPANEVEAKVLEINSSLNNEGRTRRTD